MHDWFVVADSWVSLYKIYFVNLHNTLILFEFIFMIMFIVIVEASL